MTWITSKNIAVFAIFVTFVVTLGIVAFEIVLQRIPDVFSVGIVTLILGKYINQVGFAGGSEMTANIIASQPANIIPVPVPNLNALKGTGDITP